MKKRDLLLGVDPSFSTMGVCIYDPSNRTMRLFTGKMPACIDWIQSECSITRLVAVVENPALDSTTFNMWGMVKTKIDGVLDARKRGSFGSKSATMADVQSSFAIAMNYAQKVGENKAAAKQIILMLENAKVPVIQVAPSKRQRAYRKHKGKVLRLVVETLNMPTKTTAEQFLKLTGYDKRCSEHARDAATLVWGRSMVWANGLVQEEETLRKRQPGRPDGTNGNEFLVQSSGIFLTNTDLVFLGVTLVFAILIGRSIYINKDEKHLVEPLPWVFLYIIFVLVFGGIFYW